MEAKVRAKLEKLKQERDAFVVQANMQVAALNGAIQALEQLLAPEAEAKAEIPAKEQIASENGREAAAVAAG